ncbi:DNA polymerase phi-domain-containing protein [Xylariaceae sp. FL0662B]|nr:DNA polymerase phi-domain-containing protein [Xylariaceae sp. FL0662B]
MGSKRKRSANKPGANGNKPTQKRAKTDHPPLNGSETQLDLEKTPFTETLSSEDRKREARIYQLLGSADSDERIAAADALITGLLASSEPVLERHIDNRLFRGLASSRNASRLGFSLVLTEILGQLFGKENLAQTKYPGLTFDKVLAILVEKTKTGGNVPGQEERDCYFGQLFGLQCFVESKILFSEKSRWPKVLDLLLKMADKKVWMRSHCGWIIVESLPQMGQDRAEETLRKLSDIGLGKTAEGVGIWIKARSCYPSIKTPSKPWYDPMSSGVLPEVARVLKDNVVHDIGEDPTAAKIKQSGWNAQLHFVWDLILASFSGENQTSGKQNGDQLKLFWTTVIDDGLFSKNASDTQKFRGFMIFQKFLQGLASGNKQLVNELFTRNLMKCLINQAAKEDRYLHRAALKSLQSIEKAVQTSPELLLPVLRELLGKFGAYDFDIRTNTKTIESLLQWASAANAKSVLQFLREPVLTMNDASGETEKLRHIYAGYVSKLAIQAKSPPGTSGGDSDSMNVAELGVKELASCAYSAQQQFKPSLSDKSREVFRRLLASTFGKLMRPRNDAEYLCDAVISLEPTAVSMSSEIEAERNSALKAMRKLLKTNKSDEKNSGASLGLAMLYATTILQLYDGAPDAISILQDLQRCSEKMESKESGTSELLVEILLTLVSRQSSMMRQISEQVFEAFTSQVSSEALELLTEPLFAEENEKGYQALFENIEDEDEEMDDAEDSESGEDVEDVEEDEISEIGSNVEFVTLNGAEPMENGDEDNEDDEDEAKQTEADSEELANFDDALAKVLKSHRLDKDKDAESSDNDSDMTDSEMMALDDKLVEVFKQRTKNSGKKKEKRDAKESVIMFKHRVLDFLAIYVKHEASNPSAFSLLLPLLELVRITTAKPLANKAVVIIENFSKAFKKARAAQAAINNINAEAQFALLEEIHLHAAKDASHAFARVASVASLLVASSLFANSRANVDRINAVYAQTFADCQKGEIRMQGFFFSDWVNWGMGHAANAQAGGVAS